MLDAILPFIATVTDPASVTPPVGNAVVEFITKIYGPFGVEPSRLLMQAVDFGLLAFILYRFAFKPVLATLDERQKKIAEGLQYTEDMKLKLADAKKQHTEILRRASVEAQQIVTNARNAAKGMVDKATAAAAQQAESIVKKGEAAVALERQQMLAALRREVASLVLDTTTRVLARDLTSEERSRFSNAAAQDLSKN
jgi:F-type H+-transporting ATPase subunit b